MEWDDLEKRLYDIGIDTNKVSGYPVGRFALTQILGTDNIRQCTDEFVAFGRHSELARSILLVLKPSIAIDYCIEIITNINSIAQRRHLAVRLLCDIGDQRLIALIPEWLDDPDLEVQRLSARIVEDLVFKDAISEVDSLLARMKDHPNPSVREHAANTLQFLLEHT